jgi:Cu(I)/Ag(I) efflux system membrane fusion protein
VALVFASAVGCGGDKKAAPGDASASAEGTPAASGSFIDPYITIQETLADDSVDKLAELGAQVVAGTEAVQDKPGVAEVLAGAGRVASQDIETARVGFQKMSMGLISYLKANPDARDGYQVIHCTMAFNNKGAYWVQRSGEINNPYHGKMMLRCGDPIDWEKAPG